jgi:pantetheine-phosphate adenylyltransferase
MLEETAGEVLRKAGCELKCITFDDLVVTAAHRVGATLLIRGLRDDTDFNYEMSMAGMNGAMAPDVQTVFLPASPMVRPITATLSPIWMMIGRHCFVRPPTGLEPASTEIASTHR